MVSVGIIAGVLLLVGLGVLTVVVIIDNTKVLNEQKALRAELANIEAQAQRIGPDPTNEQITALEARLAAYQKRFEAFQSSPFVITRPDREGW